MRAILLLCLLLPAGASLFAQRYAGLPHHSLYPGKTAPRLRYLADSLYARLLQSPEQPPVRAIAQTYAHHISVSGRRYRAALADLRRNLPFGAFIKKYRGADVMYGLLVRKSRELRKGKWVTAFRANLIGTRLHRDIELSDSSAFDRQWSGRWVIEDKGEWVNAFYFPDEFETPELPLRYARQVRYAGCLTDTNVRLFRADAILTSYSYSGPGTESDCQFYDYIHRSLGGFIGDDDDYSFFTDSIRWRLTDGLAHKKTFQLLLCRVYADALKYGSGKRLETYVERYLSREAALALKRGRVQEATCSNDKSPIYHAMEIARLAAESGQFPVFLRAFLHITNDNFPRQSDNSMAAQQRRTHIDDLEALGLHVSDLLMGTFIETYDPWDRRYHATGFRTGRALAELNHSKAESWLLQMVSDPALDDFNRQLAAVAFIEFCHTRYQGEGARQNFSYLTIAMTNWSDAMRRNIYVREHQLIPYDKIAADTTAANQRGL